MQHRFTPTTFLIWSGLLVYALDFLIVYVFAAIACARRFVHLQLLGLPIVPFVTTTASVLAAATIVAVMWSAARRNRDDPEVDAHTRFIRFLAIGGGGLSLIALLWLTLPPLLVSEGCASVM